MNQPGIIDIKFLQEKGEALLSLSVFSRDESYYIDAARLKTTSDYGDDQIKSLAGSLGWNSEMDGWMDGWMDGDYITLVEYRFF